MFEPVMLGTLWGVPISLYGVCVSLAAGICLALWVWNARRRGLSERACWAFALLSLPLGVLCAHLYYVAIRVVHVLPEHGLGIALRPWAGGFGLGGAVLGVALAAWLAARYAGERVAAVVDSAAPFAALMIALCRFAEGFDGAGYGDYLNNEALWFFPVGVSNVWGEYYFALFMLEGLCGLVLFAWLLRRAKRPGADQPGDLAWLFLVLFGATQIVLESLRRDQFLRFGFVRVGQLAGIAMVVLAMAVWTMRARRGGTPWKPILWHWAGLLVCVGVGVGMEFAVDKSSMPNWLCTLILAAAASGIAGLALRIKAAAGQKRQVEQPS